MSTNPDDYLTTCPACGAQATPECFAGTSREYFKRLLAVPYGLIRRVLMYIALFRTTHVAATALLDELIPVMESCQLQFQQQTHTIPPACWSQALDQMQSQRATIGRQITHNFLWKVVIGLAQKHDANAEAERELNRQAKTLIAMHKGFQTAHDAMLERRLQIESELRIAELAEAVGNTEDAAAARARAEKLLAEERRIEAVKHHHQHIGWRPNS